MVKFQLVTIDLLEHVLEILNSNAHFNILSNGKPVRTLKDARSEFMNDHTNSYLITLQDRYIGVINFLENHPKDNYPWLGLLIIHGEYHSIGYGKKVYLAFEEMLKQKNYKHLRLGVIKENINAREYWIKMGFNHYDTVKTKDHTIECFEKQLV